jgi:hypothetical protein
MIMTLKGTDDIDVHPTKVSEMERKGWTLAEPEKGSKKSTKSGGSKSKPLEEKE